MTNKENDKKKMTREDATELYRDLKRTMSKMDTSEASIKKQSAADDKVAKDIAAAIKQSMATDDKAEIANLAHNEDRLNYGPAATTVPEPFFSGNRGKRLAVSLVVIIAAFKIVVSALELSGVGDVRTAQATLNSTSMAGSNFAYQNFSNEKLSVLKALDARRVELVKRSAALDEREADSKKKERVFVGKLTQLKELYTKISSLRKENDRKRENQLDQLANVYGSMNPKESAELLGQLDITISLTLLKRMPEKRIAQILSLMSSEQALRLTRMLSQS